MRFLLPLLVALLPWNSAVGEVYKYVDRSGAVHYVDAKEKIPEEYRNAASDSSSMPSISKVTGAKFDPSTRSSSTGTNSRKKVEMFVTSWCPVCRKAEKFMRDNSLSFVARDIERDPAAMKIYKQNGAGGVPMIRIGKTVLLGFSESKIRAELGL